MTNETLKQAITTKKDHPLTIHDYLRNCKDQIKAALPKHMTADRMTRIVLTEIRKNPKLGECNPISLLGAVIQTSQLGLEPGSALGHAYLLPFENKKNNTKDVQLIIGYRGMLDLARRSGQILSINATVVYDNDDFHVILGLNPDIQHTRDIQKELGNIVAVYAVAKIKEGGTQFEFMTKREIDQVRAQSKSGNFEGSIWEKHYIEMAKKTVIRRLFKYLPVSIEIQQAVGLDDLDETEISQNNHFVLEHAIIDVESSIVKDGE